MTLDPNPRRDLIGDQTEQHWFVTCEVLYRSAHGPDRRHAGRYDTLLLLHALKGIALDRFDLLEDYDATYTLYGLKTVPNALLARYMKPQRVTLDLNDTLHDATQQLVPDGMSAPLSPTATYRFELVRERHMMLPLPDSDERADVDPVQEIYRQMRQPSSPIVEPEPDVLPGGGRRLIIASA